MSLDDPWVDGISLHLIWISTRTLLLSTAVEPLDCFFFSLKYTCFNITFHRSTPRHSLKPHTTDKYNAPVSQSVSQSLVALSWNWKVRFHFAVSSLSWDSIRCSMQRSRRHKTVNCDNKSSNHCCPMTPLNQYRGNNRPQILNKSILQLIHLLMCEYYIEGTSLSGSPAEEKKRKKLLKISCQVDEYNKSQEL